MDEYEHELTSLRLRRLALDPNRPCREKGTQTDPVGKRWLMKHREIASTEARKNPAFDVAKFNAEYPEYVFDSDSDPEVRLPLYKKTFTLQQNNIYKTTLPCIDRTWMKLLRAGPNESRSPRPRKQSPRPRRSKERSRIRARRKTRSRRKMRS